MSYQLENPRREALNKREQKLHKDLTVCKKVEQTLKTAGWKDIIEPLLNRMIVEIVGGKLGDMWIYGVLQKKGHTRDDWSFYRGQKHILIEFHNRVYNHLRQIAHLESQIEAMEEIEKKGFKVPMLEEVDKNAV